MIRKDIGDELSVKKPGPESQKSSDFNLGLNLENKRFSQP